PRLMIAAIIPLACSSVIGMNALPISGATLAHPSQKSRAIHLAMGTPLGLHQNEPGCGRPATSNVLARRKSRNDRTAGYRLFLALSCDDEGSPGWLAEAAAPRMVGPAMNRTRRFWNRVPDAGHW